MTILYTNCNVIAIFASESIIMKYFTSFIAILALLSSCKQPEEAVLNEGVWRGTMELMNSQVLPFNFSIEKKENGYVMEAYNANEVLTIDEITMIADSIYIKMPVFEGYIAGTFTNNSITGSFIKESLDRVVPFSAVHGDGSRFKPSISENKNISGVWEANFSPGTEDQYIAKGIFTQIGPKVTGTIRTTTGDYRYLEGIMEGDSLKLSTFDGAHVFLFQAKVGDSTLQGTFYSGNHFKEPFEAKRNELYELPDANSLTYIKEGYEKFSFSFPDSKGTMVSLEDEQFKDKVVVVQIMGTWCPNCLDESKFLVQYLKNNPHPDLEVLALAFEYAKTDSLAWKGISRLKDRIGVSYPVLLAQVGTSNKKTANDKLPMLNHILSYPTTIFIDKKGQVRKIHTGFNGPATGEKYEEFKNEFDAFVSGLLNE